MTGFDLVRPCPHCPFRTDRPGFLRGARAQEIAQGLAQGDTFPCHQTTIDHPDDASERIPGPNAQMCAGALLVLEHEDAPNQIMRIAERCGLYDASRLDRSSPVARSLSEFVRHHAREEDFDEEHEPCTVCDSGCLAPAGYAIGGVAIANVELDPEVLTECPGCGESVCEACAAESGFCPRCDEYADEYPSPDLGTP